MSTAQPLQPLPEHQPATIRARVAGYLFDQALAGFAALPSALGLGLLVASLKAQSSSLVWTGAALVVLGLVLTISLAVAEWLLFARRGATPGDRFAGYRLVDEADEAPGLRAAFLHRLMVWILTNFTMYVGIVVMFVVATSDPRRATFVDGLVGVHSQIDSGEQRSARVRWSVALLALTVVLTLAAMILPVLVAPLNDRGWFDVQTAP